MNCIPKKGIQIGYLFNKRYWVSFIKKMQIEPKEEQSLGFCLHRGLILRRKTELIVT